MKNPTVNINIDNNVIEHVSETKFLGIHINQHLNWSTHIEAVTNKVSKVSSAIYHASKSLNSSTKIDLYNSLAMPHMLYGNAVWGHTNDNQIQNLIKCQKRIMRNLTNSKFRDPSKPLFKKTNV